MKTPSCELGENFNNMENYMNTKATDGEAMDNKKDILNKDSLKDKIASLEWENLNLRMALEEARRDRSQAYGQLLQAHAALREVPKFLSLLVERP